MSSIKTISQNTKSLFKLSRAIYNSGRNQSLWSSDNIVKSPYKDIEIPNAIVTEPIWRNLANWEDKTALVCGVTNRSYTYLQLYKYSRSFAVSLRRKLGIRDKDVVCIMMPNSPEYAVAVLGILEAGGEVTTVNPIYTAHEVHRQLALSNPKVIIGTPQTVPVIKEAIQLAKKDIPVISCNHDSNKVEATIDFEELFLNDNVDYTILKEVNKKPEDIALLPYSSGTTGLPKGVELTHRNLVANILQIEVEGIKHYDDTTRDSQDSVMGVLPFFHIYGMTVVLLHKLAVGMKVVTLPRFQPDTFLNAMKEHKINLLLAAPPLVLFLASHKSVTKKHLENLKIFTSGAAPVPLLDIESVLHKAGPQTNFIQLYGLTETSPVATSLRIGSKKYSSAGHALPNTQLKIVDSNMRHLGPNEVGELLIKGPQIMKGYRNNPEATKAAITEDGWFKSGDSAKIDEHGVVTIADRLKELIKVKGFQVPPAELESVLKEHPSILDAAVIGVPTSTQDEAPKAFIVIKEGHKVKEEEVKKFVEERVAPYKRVKEIKVLREIPKNPSGKILRRVLKEQYSK